jgi:hypothetical protein
MDVLTLRTQIAAALADDLGTYTLLNGATTPAISVRPEGQRLAAGTTAAGLEVVILSEPRLSPVGAYLQQESIREFIVFLVGWDDTANTTLAAERLVYLFPGTVWQEIPIAKRIGPTNQCRVIIQSTASTGVLWEPLQNPIVLPKSITVPSPQVGDNYSIVRVPADTTLTAVWATVKGTSPSVTFQVLHDISRSGTGTAATASATITSTTAAEVVTIGTMPIPASHHLWLVVTAVSGTVAELSVTIET